MKDTTSQKLKLLEDRSEIQELEYRYAIAIDREQLDMLDDVFADDARFIYQGFGDFRGLDQLKALIQENAEFLDATQHMVMSTAISVKGDLAECYSYVQAQHIRQSLAPDFMLLMGGNYSDKLQRIKGRWLIVERNMSTLWGMGNPAVLNMPAQTSFIQGFSGSSS